ncbi:MAG: diaminopimelate epimerase [Flavobacteriales bacterium]|jgi:diaminopimelate epimerase|tara:strand:+ start:712 stop:1473 length:762 start_codon:yes stop_codon:yes gene_type:complete
MSTTFFKYHGAGNDFILFDNRSSVVSLTPLAIAELCDRKFGIGADGLMLLEKAKVEGDQFYMTYFNSDGLQSSMCGNGGRCIALFAKDLGLKEVILKFHAIDGAHWAKVTGNTVELAMSSAPAIEQKYDGYFVDTGSPHHVEWSTHDNEFLHKARKKRNEYGTAGVNVNYLEYQNSVLHIRTFERGVEDETLACGTGAVAAAMVAVSQGKATSPVTLQARGGQLTVSFEGTGPFENVILQGPAEFVFKGTIDL